MTKIYKFQGDIDSDALQKLQKVKEIGCDVEATGLKIPHFDKLSLIQISPSSDVVYIIQPDRQNYNCPNLVKLFENINILFIFHYARFDLNAIEYFLKCEIKNFYCSKISSKILRGYTQNHGLKDLVFEFIGKKLDKKYGSSDWNKDLMTEITDQQLEYAAADCKYLIEIKNSLNKMMVREGKTELYNNCVKFLKTRIKLDQNGYTEDIFTH
jgi:ribonuclease D